MINDNIKQQQLLLSININDHQDHQFHYSHHKTLQMFIYDIDKISCVCVMCTYIVILCIHIHVCIVCVCVCVCVYCRYLDKTTTNEVERVQEVPMTHEKVRERAKRERERGQKRESVCWAGTRVRGRKEKSSSRSRAGEKNLQVTWFLLSCVKFYAWPR